MEIFYFIDADIIHTKQNDKNVEINISLENWNKVKSVYSVFEYVM